MNEKNKTDVKTKFLSEISFKDYIRMIAEIDVESCETREDIYSKFKELAQIAKNILDITEK